MELDRLVNDGLVMVWIEKEHLVDMIKGFEKKKLAYVENITWVALDSSKEEETNKNGKLQTSFSIKD